MGLTDSSVRRAVDSTGDLIKTFQLADGTEIQAIIGIDADGNAVVLAGSADIASLKSKFIFENYQYMGSQEGAPYVYYGFKEYGGTGWYIMRKNTLYDSAWKYAYSSSSPNDWTTAWTDPWSETYGDPPDS